MVARFHARTTLETAVFSPACSPSSFSIAITIAIITAAAVVVTRHRYHCQR
jgi:hypothetical protein